MPLTPSASAIQDFLKRIDMIKVGDTITLAWDMVTPAAIRNGKN